MARLYVDTGVLLRQEAPSDPDHPAVVASLRAHRARGDDLCASPQGLREAYAVLSRPADVGGYGLTAEAALAAARGLALTFTILPDGPEVQAEWFALVEAHRVSGRQVHDAYHAATMRRHGLGTVLTLDRRDFARYGLAILDPLTPQPQVP